MKNRMLALAALCLLTPSLSAAGQQPATETRKPSAAESSQARAPITQANQDEVFKLYDLSVLGNSLNSPGAPAGIAESQLIHGLAEAFSLRVSPIGTSMFLIGAMPQDHEKIAALMLQMHETSAERYRVELATLSMPSDKVPPVGSAFRVSDASAVRIDHVIQQRSSANFEAIRTQTYIADWQPVVGNDSVGYQPQPKTTTSGLEARVWIGAADGASVVVRVNGQYSRTIVKEIELPLATGGGNLLIGLPERDQRSVHADAKLPLGEATVVGVSSGFEPGTSVVTVVRVERAS